MTAAICLVITKFYLTIRSYRNITTFVKEKRLVLVWVIVNLIQQGLALWEKLVYNNNGNKDKVSNCNCNSNISSSNLSWLKINSLMNCLIQCHLMIIWRLWLRKTKIRLKYSCFMIINRINKINLLFSLNNRIKILSKSQMLARVSLALDNHLAISLLAAVE